MCPLEPEEDCDWQTLQTKKETPDTSGMQQSDLSLYLDHRQLEWGDNKDLFHKSWKFSVHSIVEMFPPSFFIPASLFITCGFHKQQIVAEELFIITKDLYTFQCQNATFYHEHFSKGLLSLSIRLLNCVLWLQIPILDIHKKGTYS